MNIESFGPEDARIILVQPVDDHDREGLEEEIRLIRTLSGRKDFRLIAFPVNDWDEDLSPWSAPPVFGEEPFGDGAARTLQQIEAVLPENADAIYIGGYSMAGFFALWAVYQTNCFAGAAAVSPSVWFPGWMETPKRKTVLGPRATGKGWTLRKPNGGGSRKRRPPVRRKRYRRSP